MLIKPIPPAACQVVFLDALPAFLADAPYRRQSFVSGTTPAIPTSIDVGYVNAGVPGAGGFPPIRGVIVHAPADGLATPPAGASSFPTMLPQQVFTLDLKAAANNTGSIDPASAGWRFFAGTKVNKTVLGRVSRHGASHAWKLTSLFYGDRVWDAYTASLALDSAPPAQVATADYELRLLALPGLNLEAFWLEAKTPGSVDLVLPFPAAPNQLIEALNGSPVYSMPDFLDAIRPVANSLLNMSTRDGA